MDISVFALVSLTVAGLIGMYVGKALEKHVFLGLPPECALEYKNRFRKDKRLWIALPILFVIFIFLDSVLEDRAVSKYFNWDVVGMHVFITLMLITITGFNISDAIKLDIPDNNRRLLILGHLTVFCALVALLCVYAAIKTSLMA